MEGFNYFLHFFCNFCPTSASNFVIMTEQVLRSCKSVTSGFSGAFRTPTNGKPVHTLFIIIVILPTAPEKLFQDFLRWLPFSLPLKNTHQIVTVSSPAQFSDCRHEIKPRLMFLANQTLKSIQTHIFDSTSILAGIRHQNKLYKAESVIKDGTCFLSRNTKNFFCYLSLYFRRTK